MNIAAFDLGTHCGYCFNAAIGGAKFQIGTYHLATKGEVTKLREERLDRRCDPRVVNFFKLVCGVLMKDVDAIVFEDVQFGTYTFQTQLWSSYRTALQLASLSAQRLKTIECVPVGTLKKFAAFGGATKGMMAEMALKRFPSMFPGYRLSTNGLHNEEKKITLDDNAIDAFWIWAWAQQNLAKVDLDKIGK